MTAWNLSNRDPVNEMRYIRNYIENHTMAFNPKFYCENSRVVAALANTVWSGQSMVEIFRQHEEARLTWDTLGSAPQVGVPTLRRR